ncbi:MAG: hypothetical protein HOJ35_02050 [Bdellovibrionales bacterium]|jgi:o-succinylbenzoate synthase|nr:hypothetical protein [Bdellovibrionales bacterium]
MSFLFDSFKFRPFKLAFKNTVTIGKHQLNFREGLYLDLIQENRVIATSELSPLPGLHSENLTQAKLNLEKTLHFILSNQENSSTKNIKLDILLFNLFKPNFSIYPSVIFCLESALLMIIKEIRVQFQVNQKLNILQNDLFLPSSMNLEKHISDWNRKKLTKLKIKIGRIDLEDEISIINTIINETSSSLQLRLDGNQSLTDDQMLYLCKNINLSRVEYFEEPTSNILKLSQFIKKEKLNIFLAVDESLGKFDLNKELPKEISHLIIKPNLVGGISKTINYFNLKDKEVVLSSSFESEIGLNYISLLAQYQTDNFQQVEAGLDTLKFFK